MTARAMLLSEKTIREIAELAASPTCYSIGAQFARTLYEAERNRLMDEIERLKAMVPQPCQECSGQGMIESVGMEHGSGCTDSRCCSDCPVPVQVLEPCSTCGGYGALMIPLPEKHEEKGSE